MLCDVNEGCKMGPISPMSFIMGVSELAAMTSHFCCVMGQMYVLMPVCPLLTTSHCNPFVDVIVGLRSGKLATEII